MKERRQEEAIWKGQDVWAVMYKAIKIRSYFEK